MRVQDHYVLFRFVTEAEVRKGRPPGLRMVARVVARSVLLGRGVPPNPRLVERLLSTRRSQIWQDLKDG